MIFPSLALQYSSPRPPASRVVYIVMTSNSMKAQKPVGSAAWISAEKENIAQLVNQEIEEIEYPVRHEMLWLNEHMAEIFSKNQVSVMLRCTRSTRSLTLRQESCGCVQNAWKTTW